jgi:hypothetical protein
MHGAAPRKTSAIPELTVGARAFASWVWEAKAIGISSHGSLDREPCPGLARFGVQTCFSRLFFSEPRVPRKAAARQSPDPIESDRGSRFLFYRIFLTRTGIHFARKLL